MVMKLRPGELVWVHNDMVAHHDRGPIPRRTLDHPVEPCPTKLLPIHGRQDQVLGDHQPSPGPAALLLHHALLPPAGQRTSLPQGFQECPPTCSGHGYALHDTIILLSGKTRHEAMLSLINANHPHRVAHMISESDMFDEPDSVDASEHYRHVFRPVEHGPDRHCVCCHIGHAMTWYQCDCGANACSYCTTAGADGHLHGLNFN